MKELTIEQKAQKYDNNYKVYTELINRLEDVKGAIKKQNYGIAMDILCKPYPEFQITASTELKESEDEKIRKELIEFLGETIENVGDSPNKWTLYNAKKWRAWLEKQGEQEEPQVYETEDDEVITYSESEGYKVVEPKFKVGDWLVHNERRIIIKVLKATPLVYEVVDVLGYHHTITDTAIENNYHLWTIKDAKKGDVLIAENIIFIYKKALASHIVSYCKLINDVFESTVDARTCCEGNPYVHPATIEQRDTLFSKMEEAGYAFDFRNKELKKLTEKI